MAEKHRKAKNDMRIKFHEHHHSALTKISEATGAQLTAIVRLALDDFLPKYAEGLVRGGILSELPPELRELKMPNPQSRTRRVGRVRKVVPMVLAALVAGSASQLRADSRVSTFVQGQNDPLLGGHGLCIIGSWKRKGRKAGKTTCVLAPAA